MQRQELFYRFSWGMSILNSYISFNNNLNYQDINIFSENFMADLLSIIYDMTFRNENNETCNSVGYDLICEQEKTIIQVSSSATSDKIIRTFKKLSTSIQSRKTNLQALNLLRKKKEKGSLDPIESKSLKRLEKEIHSTPDLSGYNIKFLILKQKAEAQRAYLGNSKKGYTVPESLHFNPSCDIIDLTNLTEKVNSLSELDNSLKKLDIFMKKNSNIFIKGVMQPEPNDESLKRIEEYADNFTGRLFRHTYDNDSDVRLQNLYVDPAFYPDNSSNETSRDMVSLISQFLWQNNDIRMLFIDGDAAVGKTSLVSWLCYHYIKISTENHENSIGKAIFLGKKLICIRLRELDFINNVQTAKGVILSYLNVKIPSIFEEKYREAVIVLDGVDELSMVEKISIPSIEDFLLSLRKEFKSNKFIITCRPQFIDMQKFKSSTFKIQHITLSHFDEVMRREWINKYEQCGEEIPVSTKAYILSLDNNAANGVADTPLALYLLVACEMNAALEGNIWALYHEIFKNAIMKTEYNENFRTGTSHPASENLDIIYSVVCEIAFKMFQISNEERYYITGEELDAIISKMDIKNIPLEWVRHCCVLCAYWKNNTSAGALEFYHNDIRDFFFCEYIYHKLLKHKNTNDEFKLDISRFIKTLCEIFQYASITGTTWEQTFTFLYLRIKYQHQHSNAIGPYQGPDITNPKFLPAMFNNLLSRKELYSYDYPEQHYTCMKRVFCNSALFLRLLMQVHAEKHNILKLWENESQKDTILHSNILFDWHEVFLKTVKTPNQHFISLGNHMDLSKIDLHQTRLNDAYFNHSILDSANFSYTNLVNAYFSNATLDGTNFSNADLCNADFTSAILNNVNFTNANLTGAIFDSAQLSSVSFHNCTLNECSFHNATLVDIDFKSRQLSNIILSKAKFINCNLSNVKFKKSHLDCVTFTNSELKSINFEGSTIYDVAFNNNNMDKSDFTNSDQIEKVRFESSSLIESRFSNSKLFDVDFGTSDLAKASFTQATLSNVELNRAHLHFSHFLNAQIHQCDMDGIHLNSAMFVI